MSTTPPDDGRQLRHMQEISAGIAAGDNDTTDAQLNAAGGGFLRAATRFIRAVATRAARREVDRRIGEVQRPAPVITNEYRVIVRRGWMHDVNLIAVLIGAAIGFVLAAVVNTYVDGVKLGTAGGYEVGSIIDKHWMMAALYVIAIIGCASIAGSLAPRRAGAIDPPVLHVH